MTDQPKATLEQVLGIPRKKCIFQERFKYEPCRSCEGYNYKCTNYLAQIRYEVNLKEKQSWREK